MELCLRSAVPIAPSFYEIYSAKRRPVKARPVYCLGKNGNSIGSNFGPLQRSESHENVEMSQDMLQAVNIEPQKRHNDIRQLFREAQQNILHLNKQRLMAVAELENLRRENKSLLDYIGELELKANANSRRDKHSVCSELLLRIDSMVLIGMVSTAEASDLRRLVIDLKYSVADELLDILNNRDAEILAELRQFASKSKRKGFHVLHICTEMAPAVSVGPLASYVTGLSCALQRKGNLVEVILPKYASLDLDEVEGLREINAEFYSHFNGQLNANRIWTGVVQGIGVTFIQPVYYSSFFSGERIYGNANDIERFTYFSRAALEYVIKSGKQPDVLHIHNWETSIVGPLFWEIFVNQGLGATKILITCQDLDSQCVEQPDRLGLCGLDPSRLHRHDRFQDNKEAHFVNFLKGGIVYSNKVIIMSSILSKDQIIGGLGHGLEPTLAVHRDKLLIAPHGLDHSMWDPSTDKFLPQSYSADDMRGKVTCKVALQQHLGLPEHESQILVGCFVSGISDSQVEYLKKIVSITSKGVVQFIFMGSSSIPGTNTALESIQEEFKDENVRFLNKYDEALSHLIFAGSDIILCPSFDDPVLQVPLKAIRYGAAPIAVNLADISHAMNDGSKSTKFSKYISKAFADVSLNRAIEEIRNNPSQWNNWVIDAMRKDFSWDAECCDVHVSAYASILNL